MKILLVHNRYQISGGEDTVFAAEKAMLEGNGHEVSALEASNLEIAGWLNQARAGVQAVYSLGAKRRLAAEIARFYPDIVHVHNFFPLLSPSIYSVCHETNVPVVQTLHNYRLICPCALLFRDGHTCEDCVGKFAPWPGIVHGCYRGSRLATVPVAAMLTVHRALNTWAEKVDAYIALTEFAREKFVAGGLPAQKIVVKPNFVDPAPACGTGRGGYALFVGRLSEEKGVRTLLAAWEQNHVKMPLKIAGDGPLSPDVRAAAQPKAGIEWLGRVPRERVVRLMQDAAALVFPSVWYETFGMSIIESFAVGLPVVASKMGTANSLVEHKRTGLHFRPGDAADLAGQIEWLGTHSAEWNQMRDNARREFESRYTAQRNYEQLMSIYGRCIEQSKARQL